MPDFSFKMHQIQFRLPQTPLKELTALPRRPDPIEEEKREESRKEGRERRGGGKEGKEEDRRRP